MTANGADASIVDARLTIWATLDDESEARLATRIEDVAARLGTPSFTPHLTVVGVATPQAGVVAAAIAGLAAATPRFEVQFSSVSHSSTYFRAVVLECGDGSDVLDRLRGALSPGDSTSAKYRPHLSVAYGDLAPQLREQLACEFADELPSTVHVTALELWDLGDGEPASWHGVASAQLAG